MVIVDPDQMPALTVKALREILEDLPDESIIMCEDGNFVCSTATKVKICSDVAVGRESKMRHVLVSEDDCDTPEGQDESRYFKEFPLRETLELKYPILCFEVSGRFVLDEDKPQE